jgi:preprotein translocase subunit YajC
VGRSCGVVEDHVHVLLSEYMMQPEPTTGGTAQPGATSHEAQGQGQSTGPGFELQLPILALMFGLFYFLMIRPQQKRQRETDSMLKALKRGDIVRTSGGIRGEIVSMTDTEVVLLIDDKVKINLLRSHIAGKADAAAAKEKA